MSLESNTSKSQQDTTANESVPRLNTAVRSAVHKIVNRLGDLPTQLIRSVQGYLRDILARCLDRRKHKSRSSIHEGLKSMNFKEILDTLEEILGPIQLLIVSQKSGQAILQHRIKDDALVTWRDTVSRQDVTVDIFGKKYAYLVQIHGINQPIEGSRWGDFIQGIIENCIKETEQERQRGHQHILYELKKREESMGISIGSNNNYGEFISEILRNRDIPGVQKAQQDPEYIDNCIQAIDICRRISRGMINQDTRDLRTISSQIDAILGGRIHRKVLDMVTTILLSRDETMNGLGYPSNLSKSDIPLEGRLYQIIRAYEVYCSDILPDEISDTMQQWAKKSCIDTDILSVFLDSLLGYGVAMREVDDTIISQSVVSDRHHDVYVPYIQSWHSMIQDIHQIQLYYGDYYAPTTDIDRKRRLMADIDPLRESIPKAANLMKLVAATGHGDTKSDNSSSPGNETESTTFTGKKQSARKGRKFQKIELEIHASPLTRAMESAQCMAHAMTLKESGLSILEIIPEPSLRNPTKHLDTSRRDAISKLILNQPKDLLEFVQRIYSLPRDSTHLCVTHGSTGRALMWILQNIGLQEIQSKATEFSNNQTYHFLIRGGRAKEYDLCFHPDRWKYTLAEINGIADSIFGELFYTLPRGSVDLVALHKKLLDYIDNKNETDPEKVGKLIQALDDNPLTAHFSAILRTEGVIK